jgi:hypothetical protein
MGNELFFFTARADSINKEAGILAGVSMVTIGPVRGHGVYADAKTLETVKACAETHKGGLKVKMEHGNGAESIVGVLKGYRIEGTQLRADLQLLKAGDQYSKLLEMAETMPEAFGLSIAFSGDRERVKIAEVDLEAMRCREIYSCDVVDAPAANPNGLFQAPKPPANLFQAKKKRERTNLKGRRQAGEYQEATLEDLDETLLDVQETVDSIENDLAAISATEAAILAGVQAIQTMLPELVEAAVKRGANGDLIALRRLGAMGVPAGTVPPANSQAPPPTEKPKSVREQLEAIPASDIFARRKFFAEHETEIYAEMHPAK